MHSIAPQVVTSSAETKLTQAQAVNWGTTPVLQLPLLQHAPSAAAAAALLLPLPLLPLLLLELVDLQVCL